MASSGAHKLYTPQQEEFWIALAICAGLVLFSGFCSGATQGLLSIDQLGLEIKRKHGSDMEKQMANTILPILEQHHLLLSTLLISNATANESLPIFLHSVAPDWLAVIISSIFVVLFGEVVPSAFTTGPDQLIIAVKMIPFVKFLQSVLYIIVYPLSLFLDWILGIHDKQRDLRALLQLHALPSDGKMPLSKEEINLMIATMDLRDELVVKQAIDMSKVFMVSSDEKFSGEFAHKLRVKGFSRIPVYAGQNRHQILGTFNGKSILKYGEQDYGKAIRSLVNLQETLTVSKDTTLLEMMMLFEEKRKTLAFISERPKAQGAEDLSNDVGKIIGIICMNDIFEEMLDVELKDDDVHGTLRNDPFVKKGEKGRQLELGVIREGSTSLSQRIIQSEMKVSNEDQSSPY